MFCKRSRKDSFTVPGFGSYRFNDGKNVLISSARSQPCSVSCADKPAHGASASDAFHLVIPSMPGYGFSGKPSTPGWDPVRIARAWVVLMKRLGYTQFVAQGGSNPLS